MTKILIAGLLVATTIPVMAQQMEDAAATVDAARAAIEAQAAELDTDRNDVIDRDEIAAAAEAGFATFDVDGSGDIDPREFAEWPFGFYEMAQHRGQTDAYHTAFGLIFDIFDQSSDRRLDRQEFQSAMLRSLDDADSDGDGAMSHDEFLRGFVPNVALRHAMED
ncbi:MAG: hypothetical protein AAF264_01915 [Pseudomonadota bacterium]